MQEYYITHTEIPIFVIPPNIVYTYIPKYYKEYYEEYYEEY
jgi:hypothetical protein